MDSWAGIASLDAHGVTGPLSNTITSPLSFLMSDSIIAVPVRMNSETVDSGPRIKASPPSFAASAVISSRRSSKLSNTVSPSDLMIAIAV